MPKIKKIRAILLQPLLEEHNKIANLIDHLDDEIQTMLNDPEPDTDFIEISIVLLNNYIRRYHTIENDIIPHFDQYDLNMEKKLKIMTLFNEHRESLPLLDRLIELNEELVKPDADTKTTLTNIKGICDSLHNLLHALGKKYFSNILINKSNHIKPNGLPSEKHHHHELDIDGEVFTDDVNASSDCTLRDISEEGVTICSEKELPAGERVEVRCRNVPGTPVLACEVLKTYKEGAHFCHDLRIDNIAECRNIMDSIVEAASKK